MPGSVRAFHPDTNPTADVHLRPTGRLLLGPKRPLALWRESLREKFLNNRAARQDSQSCCSHSHTHTHTRRETQSEYRRSLTVSESHLASARQLAVSDWSYKSRESFLWWWEWQWYRQVSTTAESTTVKILLRGTTASSKRAVYKIKTLVTKGRTCFWSNR